MIHNCYPKHRNYKGEIAGSQEMSRQATGSRESPGKQSYDLKEDRVLNIRVNSLLNKYKGDPDALEELKNKIGMFVINVSIARNLKSKDSEKEVRRSFNQYLNTL